MNERRIAEVFPPGEFISDELEIRGWTQEDLAVVIGRTENTVNRIIAGKSGITPETAKLLGDAFGTSPQYWMNLDTAYRLHNTETQDPWVEKRSKLYSKAPINEMIKRGWIESSENIEVLEQRVLEFFQIEHIDEQPEVFAHAARQSTPYGGVSSNQLAWLYRGKHLGKAVTADTFTEARLEQTIPRITALLESPVEIRHVPKLLADAGIRFILVRNLPNTRIDGASFWYAPDAPVIVLSMRYDRNDWFWHTLMHEIGHIKNRDESLDVELYSDTMPEMSDKPEMEIKADAFSANTLVPTEQIEHFIARVGPLYSKRRIEGFAKRLQVHPGVVVGQLHHRRELKYSQHRSLLAKVREIICETTLSDGWDTPLPVNL